MAQYTAFRFVCVVGGPCPPLPLLLSSCSCRKSFVHVTCFSMPSVRVSDAAHLVGSMKDSGSFVGAPQHTGDNDCSYYVVL